MSFANQSLSLEYLAQTAHTLPPKVHDVPRDIDEEVGRLKLRSMGIEIDALTAEQEAYLASWGHRHVIGGGRGARNAESPFRWGRARGRPIGFRRQGANRRERHSAENVSELLWMRLRERRGACAGHAGRRRERERAVYAAAAPRGLARHSSRRNHSRAAVRNHGKTGPISTESPR